MAGDTFEWDGKKQSEETEGWQNETHMTTCSNDDVFFFLQRME